MTGLARKSSLGYHLALCPLGLRHPVHIPLYVGELFGIVKLAISELPLPCLSRLVVVAVVFLQLNASVTTTGATSFGFRTARMGNRCCVFPDAGIMGPVPTGI